MLAEKRVLLTDTGMRDRTSSLLATRFRTHDLELNSAVLMRRCCRSVFGGSWGARPRRAMRFLKEDPWARLAAFREAMPNLLLQMLFRLCHAVGYTNYPDNVYGISLRAPATRASTCFAFLIA